MTLSCFERALALAEDDNMADVWYVRHAGESGGRGRGRRRGKEESGMRGERERMKSDV